MILHLKGLWGSQEVIIYALESLPEYLSSNLKVLIPFKLVIPLLNICPEEIIIDIDKSLLQGRSLLHYL